MSAFALARWCAARWYLASLPLAVALACGPAAPPSAVRLAEWHGADPGDQLGTSLALLGDLDGDGLPEVALGASRLRPGANLSGSIRIAASSGQTLLTLDGLHGNDGFGLAMAGYGDADGDGHPDLLVGAPQADDGGLDAGRIVLVSGAEGRILLSVVGPAAGDALGVAVAAPGDVDGDGVPDLAGGALQPALGPDRDAGPGALRVYSGADGHPLYSRAGLTGQDDYASSLCAPGDLDGDGIGDLLVGVPGVGAVEFLSGVDGHTLLRRESKHGGFGTTVAPAGDVDRDGVVDVAVGAPQGSRVQPLAGAVVILSGRDGSELGTFHGELTGARLGAALAPLGDLDEDGLPELAIGGAGCQHVSIVSLPAGEVRLKIPALSGEDRFGLRLASAGDLLLVGFPGQGADGSLPGGAALYRLLMP